jgi:hypothetical protein
MSAVPETAEAPVQPEGARLDRAPSPAAVRIHGVSQVFDRAGAPVLDGVDLTVEPGEFAARCLGVRQVDAAQPDRRAHRADERDHRGLV